LPSPESVIVPANASRFVTTKTMQAIRIARKPL
jgi:hypothetical protein